MPPLGAWPLAWERFRHRLAIAPLRRGDALASRLQFRARRHFWEAWTVSMVPGDKGAICKQTPSEKKFTYSQLESRIFHLAMFGEFSF